MYLYVCVFVNCQWKHRKSNTFLEEPGRYIIVSRLSICRANFLTQRSLIYAV